MSLNRCPRRTFIRLVDIQIAPEHQRRLSELGLRKGAIAVITQKAGFGGRVLNIAGSRIAVDYASTKKIFACLVEEEQVEEEKTLSIPVKREVRA